MESHSSASDAWARILAYVKEVVSEQTFRTWFSPLSAGEFDRSRLTIVVPNPFYSDWLQEHYSELLTQAVGAVFSEGVAMSFVVSDDYSDTARPLAPSESSDGGDAAATNGVMNGAGARASGMRQARVAGQDDGLLNPRFTFENFVVGKSNEFCFAACEAVAKSPGNVYNPLFIYGGVGLGKTHIMQAIGHRLRQNRPSSHVRYVSSEKFMNEMIQSIQRGTTFEFKRRYRSADLLFIDDIQFLTGKESTQEEFFHTFNTLYDAHKQIVITSDRPPKALNDLEDRLVSRFNWGLVSDISAPDYETRVAILRRKAEAENMEISNDVLMCIADRITNNVRELEGSLVRLSALASLTKSKIDVDLVQEFLKDLMRDRSHRPVEARDVVKVVCAHFGLSAEALRSRRRTQKIAFPRQVAMYLCKQLTNMSLVEIGAQFGGRDHTTVLYACDKIESRRTQDPELDRTLDELTQALSTPSRS